VGQWSEEDGDARSKKKNPSNEEKPVPWDKNPHKARPRGREGPSEKSEGKTTFISEFTAAMAQEDYQSPPTSAVPGRKRRRGVDEHTSTRENKKKSAHKAGRTPFQANAANTREDCLRAVEGREQISSFEGGKKNPTDSQRPLTLEGRFSRKRRRITVFGVWEPRKTHNTPSTDTPKPGGDQKETRLPKVVQTLL